ncbi:MAG: hypothetical protein L6R38_007174 [Xanthoria sp. 2 TBL-2021]|nr:MAG: hypothetical protein L6R38_007174 [Xanthoria sp. 2 TBL-2021]
MCQDYLDWAMGKMTRAVQEAKAVPKPTSQDFWKAAYDYDPLGPNPPPDGSVLQKIFTSGCMEPISIGRIYGKTLLKLLPVMGALPAPDIPDFETPFDFAATDSAAISYPDAYPSEEELTPQGEELSSGAMAQTPTTVKAQDDDKLRHFAALGWVLQEGRDGGWNKTGHVLVIDMDDRDIRHRHPWLVLASEWPTDGTETPEGGFTIYAEEEVGRNDSTVPGVFPGDENRTPVCRIMPRDKEAGTDVPVLKQLGDNFSFIPERLGGHHPTRSSCDGPALANVMEWYWDPESAQEVCYTKDGLEYMRYDRRSKEYIFPDIMRLSFAGEQGLFGEIEGPAQEEPSGRPVSLEERLAGSHLGDPATSERAPTRSREKSSSMGF